MNRLLAMQVFAKVAELGSFSRAAADLGLSRARASEVVQDLEGALKTRLLHRTTRSLALTDSGRAYFDRISHILGDILEAENEVRNSSAAVRGRLRVELPVALTRLYVLPKLPKLLHRYPELELEIRMENRILELTREGVDCAVTYGKPSDPDLVVRPLATTKMLTCASPSYWKRHPAPKTPVGLSKHNLIAFLGSPWARPVEWHFSDPKGQTSFRPTGNLAFNSMEACLEAAAMNLGVTQVWSSVAHNALRDGRLVPILTSYVSEGPGLYFSYRSQHQASARLRAFSAFLVEVFSALGN